MKDTMRAKLPLVALVTALAALLAVCTAAAGENPFFPGYIGDPHITRDPDTGTFLVYGTTDGYGSGDDLAGGPFCVRESNDLVNWTTTPFSFEDGTFPQPTRNMWAPAAVKGKDGRWYFYYICRGVNCFVASSETPRGPWKGELDNKPLAPGMFDSDAVMINGRTFVITMNGSHERGDWGVWIGELNDDMLTWKRPLARAYFGRDLFEGPGLFERNGKWYLTYSNGSLAGSYHVNYAIADNPFGPYKADTPNNPIMSPDYGTGIICTGHNNVIRIGDDYYICYHRKASPGSVRQGALQKIEFRADGTIVPMKPATTYERPDLPLTETRPNLARGRLATASSEARGSKADVTRAARASSAVDGDYATLWKAATRGEEWLQVDLGTVCDVEEVRTHFEFDAAVYRYRLEGSADGKAWVPFADRSADGSKVNPRVDKGAIRARYLRWSFKEGTNVNYDETVGVFEVWVYGKAGPDVALRSFEVNGKAAEAFAPERTEFTVWVADADEAKIVAAPRDPAAKVKVEPAQAKLPFDATVVVTEPGGGENRYRVRLNRLGDRIAGSVFGCEPESAAHKAEAAFDGDAATWFEGFDVDGAYAGVDVGEGKGAAVASVAFVPRKGNAKAMVGGVFEGSDDGREWTPVATVAKEPDAGWNYVEGASPKAFRLLRYRGPAGSSGCVAEVAFYGSVRKVAGQPKLAAELSPRAKRVGDAVTASGERLLNDWSFEGGGRGWKSPWPIKPEKANAFDGVWAVNPNSSGRLVQTLVGLKNGTYDFSLQVQGDGRAAEDKLEVFASSTASGELTVTAPVAGWRRWSKVTVKGVKVTDGGISVGFALKRTGRSGLWAWIDCAELVRTGD